MHPPFFSPEEMKKKSFFSFSQMKRQATAICSTMELSFSSYLYFFVVSISESIAEPWQWRWTVSGHIPADP